MSGSRYSNEDQLSFTWLTPRPAYVREIEPLARAWKSPEPRAGVEDPLLTPEQLLNRKLFVEGRNRKQPSAVSSQPSAERRTG